MIIVMQPQAAEADIAAVIALIHARGLSEHVSRGAERTIIGAVGDERVFDPQELESMPGVEKAMRVLHSWRIISRETQAEDSRLSARSLVLGGGVRRIALFSAMPAEADALLADPFFVPGNPYTQQPESENQQIRKLQAAVATIHAQDKAAVVRLRDVRQLEAVLQAEADVLYLGGELMTNRALQAEVGRLNMPVVVCKDKHHTVEDWLTAAEHIALKGNHLLILGEAGTLSLNPHAPYRLDVDAISQAKILTHLPVLANILRLPHKFMPAHTLWQLAVAAGADAVVA